MVNNNVYYFPGAVDNDPIPKLTVLGKKMAAFPIDPKYSKVLLSASEYNCLDEVCLVPRTRFFL